MPDTVLLYDIGLYYIGFHICWTSVVASPLRNFLSFLDYNIDRRYILVQVNQSSHLNHFLHVTMFSSFRY